MGNVKVVEKFLCQFKFKEFIEMQETVSKKSCDTFGSDELKAVTQALTSII